MRAHGSLDQAPLELGPYDGHSSGFTRRILVDRARGGSVHQEMAVAELEAGGVVALHLHAFEHALYVLEGSIVVDLAGGSEILGTDDWLFIDRGVAHAIRNASGAVARWLEVSAPQPGATLEDTVFPAQAPAIDADPPFRRGHFDPADLPPPTKTGIALAGFSAANVGGASLKVLVGPQDGATQLLLMVVQYVEGGFIGPHDHAFEEGFLFVAGEMEATLEGETHTLRPGDWCWSGVGSVHSFRNPGSAPVRWLETQVPLPPSRYQARFVADWERFTATQ